MYKIGCLPETEGVSRSAPEIILAPLAPPSYFANHLAKRNDVSCLFLLLQWLTLSGILPPSGVDVISKSGRRVSTSGPQHSPLPNRFRYWHVSCCYCIFLK